MTSIWIDADACPKIIKEVIFKAAKRTKIECFVVANQFMSLPSNPLVKRIIVEQGFDKADNVIEESVVSGDVVITADLPLAEECLNKKASVISPRGELFSLSTIKQKLAMRDFNEVMRGSGLHSKGMKPLNNKDVTLFANQLDRVLAKLKKQ